MKVCSTCGEDLPFEAFYRQPGGSDGYAARCRRCKEVARKARAAPVQLVGEKRCCGCGEVKPYGEFSGNRGTRDGYASRCRPCRNVYQKQWKASPQPRREYGLRADRDDTSGTFCPRCSLRLPHDVCLASVYEVAARRIA